MNFPTFKYETKKFFEGYRLVAGCDEAGIGPLAGPVVAATVILNPDSVLGRRSKNKWWSRIRDSKTVKEKERAQLVNFICDHCLDYAVGVVSSGTIDRINILQASLLAMRKSVDGLRPAPDFIFLDGRNTISQVSVPQEAIIRGDGKILSVAAASILAKVERDKIMSKFHELYPQYNFVKHKGYPTKEHKLALQKFGTCPEHRTSFAFVQQVISQFYPSDILRV